jgi:putative membrane protein insertion efficiency factor
LVYLSILAIKKIWHGKIGRTHNRILNMKCRYNPSCSNYAILALEKYGFVKGWLMSIKRIHNCTRKVPFGTNDYP